MDDISDIDSSHQEDEDEVSQIDITKEESTANVFGESLLTIRSQEKEKQRLKNIISHHGTKYAQTRAQILNTRFGAFALSAEELASSFEATRNMLKDDTKVRASAVAKNVYAKIRNTRRELEQKSPDSISSFTIPIPSTLTDLESILHEKDLPEQSIIFDRIFDYNYAILDKDKSKWIGFLNSLFSLLGSKFENIDWFSIHSLVGPIQKAMWQIPTESIFVCQDILTSMNAKITKKISRLKKQSADSYFDLFANSTIDQSDETANQNPFSKHILWPKLKIMGLCQLFTLIFDWDHHNRDHPVLHPLSVYLTHLLAMSPVSSSKDIVSGLFICSLLSTLASKSLKFFPELVDWLLVAFSWTMIDTPHWDTYQNHCTLNERFFIAPGFNPFDSWTESTLEDPSPFSVKEMMELLSISQNENTKQKTLFDANFQARCVSTIVVYLRQTIILYQDYDSRLVIFHDLIPIMAFLKSTSSSLQELGETASDILGSVLDFPPVPLRFDSKVTKVVTFDPSFHLHFQPGRDYDPDTERRHTRYLKKQLVTERRKRQREIREENIVEMRTRQSHLEEEKATHATLMNRIMDSLRKGN